MSNSKEPILVMGNEKNFAFLIFRIAQHSQTNILFVWAEYSFSNSFSSAMKNTYRPFEGYNESIFSYLVGIIILGISIGYFVL